MGVPEHIRDPEEIYRQSFATVEAEAKLYNLPDDIRDVAIRLIHSCGMVDLVEELVFSKSAVEAGQKALLSGNSIFTDVEMVRAGITGRFLPAGNEVVCTLTDARVPEHAKEIGNTRSAAAIDFWDDRLDGAIAVFGNAPTALFRLLERLDGGGPRPAVILGFPVGFVGAAESKAELVRDPRGSEFIALRGRRGGSAMAAAAVNAIAMGCRS